jgi:hypothetical protein
MFLCAHPALAADAQVGLILRLLAGLSTGEIATAFLVLPVIQDEYGGVIGLEHVLAVKSPARRSRAGLGVQGVAGMVSLSR